MAESKSSSSYFSTIFGSADVAKATEKPTKGEANPNDIPKEELLQLCMKLNKRMHTLESKHTDLIQKHKVLGQERNALFDLIRSSMRESGSVVDSDDVALIGELWTQQTQQERLSRQKLEDEIQLLKSSSSCEISSLETATETEVNVPSLLPSHTL
jgi:hypothetical protein